MSIRPSRVHPRGRSGARWGAPPTHEGGFVAGTNGEHQQTGRAAHPAGSALPAAVLAGVGPALTAVEARADDDGISWRSSSSN